MTTKLDRSPQAVRDRMDRVASLMAGVPASAPTAERDAARRRFAAQVEVEEIKAAEAAAAKAQATAERARVRSIIRVGIDLSRPRQALRLALAGPVDAAQAQAILPGLPLDQDASETALTLPGAASFGTPAAQIERRRLSAVFSHPSATGRFGAACALALEGSEALPVEAVTGLLSGLPMEAAPQRIETIEERAAGLAEFGSDWHTSETKEEKISAMWSHAISEANRSIGATGPVPALQDTTRTPTSADHDPAFGTIAAMQARLKAGDLR